MSPLWPAQLAFDQLYSNPCDTNNNTSSKGHRAMICFSSFHLSWHSMVILDCSVHAELAARPRAVMFHI